jgi:hypothetical protein
MGATIATGPARAAAGSWRSRPPPNPGHFTTFLARAVYGPDRPNYWQQVLASAEQADPAAPARQRIGEVEQAIADLRRRLRNQLLSLEDDDLKPEARRHITSRIAELEQAIADHQASLAKLQRDLDLPVAALEVLAPSLDGLPMFGGRRGSSAWFWSVPWARLERATYCLGGSCSIR